MSRSIDLDNPRYQNRYERPFGELCTRMRMINAETIDGVSCCYGLISDQTDEYEESCLKCKHFLIWQY